MSTPGSNQANKNPYFASAGDIGTDASSSAESSYSHPSSSPAHEFASDAPTARPTLGSFQTFVPPNMPSHNPPAPHRSAPIPMHHSAPPSSPPYAPPSAASHAVKHARSSGTRTKAPDRISVANELKLLLRQGILVLLGERRNLIISLLFPFIASLITVWIAGEDMFNTFEATKSACFILVCASIWGGLFNSIQSLVKERENIKRDYVSGALRIECYLGSRAIIQLVLCLIQSFVLSMSVPLVEWVHGNDMPASGLFDLPVMVEVYISLFLIMYASDALGLLISSIVKKEELASKLAPYILIAQLLFSGVLFKLEGAANVFSGIMISRWGMEALGSIFELNDTPTKVYAGLVDEGAQSGCPCGLLDELKYPEFDGAFEAEAGHLALVFFIMLLFVIIPLVAGNFMLHRVKNDSRE